MDISSWPATLQLGLGLVAVSLVYTVISSLSLWNRRRAFKRAHGVEEAPRLPQTETILGLGALLVNIRNAKEHRLLEAFNERFVALGVYTFQFTLLGRHLHATIEPENLKTIQAIDNKKWSLGRRRKRDFDPLLGTGIFTTDGHEWQHSREMLRPNFVRSQVADLSTFEDHMQKFVKNITPNQTVDLSVLFFRLTIDTATEFLFGESTNSLVEGDGGGFAAAFTDSQDAIAKDGRFGPVFKYLLRGASQAKFREDCKFVHAFVDRYVDKGIAKRQQLLRDSKEKDQSSSGRYVFIDELVRQTTDRKRIRDELLNILLAGRDTTASLLTNVWFILAQRPDIWARLQEEINTLDGRLPTWEQLKDLKYLRAVLNESLRLHPVVPMNSREATEDTTLPLGGGPNGRSPIMIKKGNIVVWNVYALHRRKDYYGEDAEEFCPERWLDDPVTGKKGLRPGWEYLPFNGGARICLGQQYALTEASYATVRLCQMFDGIECRDERGPNPPWVEFATLTCVNLHGAKVALRPRAQ